MLKNVPNNAKYIYEDTTTDARSFLPVHLVRFSRFWYVLVRFGTFWYILVRFGTFWYVLVHFGTFWYILVHFGTFWYVSVRRHAASDFLI
jgi:hypothetical protein